MMWRNISFRNWSRRHLHYIYSPNYISPNFSNCRCMPSEDRSQDKGISYLIWSVFPDLQIHMSSSYGLVFFTFCSVLKCSLNSLFIRFLEAFLRWTRRKLNCIPEDDCNLYRAKNRWDRELAFAVYVLRD